MKKFIGIIVLTIVFAFVPVLQAEACWAAPEPLEIFSDDGSMVFVFDPIDDYSGLSNAAVYEIADNERRLVYSVENLSSFSFKNSFYFSNDMMHFVRVFPNYGMFAFEVFSYGTMTRVVMRKDFIDDYATVKSESSIGPFYKVTWNIENDLIRDTFITINTDEKTVLFDLATATFYYENDLPVDFGNDLFIDNDEPLEVSIASISNTLPPYYISNELPGRVSSTTDPQPKISQPVIIILSVTGVVFLVSGVILTVKRKKEE